MAHQAKRAVMAISAILAAMLFAPSVHGQATSSWLGKKVVAKYRHLSRSDIEADSGSSLAIYTATLVHDDLVRLVYNRQIRWAPASDLVLRDQAISFYTDEIDRDPANSDAYTCRGELFLQESDHGKAIEDFTTAIRLNPNDSLAYKLRGSAWLNKASHDRAIEDFTTAIRLNPNDASVYRRRASVWSSKGQEDKALADLDETIRRNPEDELAHGERGFILLNQGKTRKAQDDFRHIKSRRVRWIGRST